jgi:hypothetical protein
MIATLMRRHLSCILFAALCLGCTNRAVVKGALTTDERQEYVEQTGALIPQRLKDDFVAGNAAAGMSKEMVVFLYGQPDRTENNRYGISWNGNELDSVSMSDQRDSLWNYFGSDSVSVKRGMVFKGDTLMRVVGDLAR